MLVELVGRLLNSPQTPSLLRENISTTSIDDITAERQAIEQLRELKENFPLISSGFIELAISNITDARHNVK